MPGQDSPRLSGNRHAARHATACAMMFASLALGACLDMGNSPDCTPADTTHSCCVKNNPARPEICDGRESVANKPVGRKAAVVATLTLTLNDVDTFQAAQPEIEDILMKCARLAEDEINRLHLRGRKTRKEECDKEIEKKPDGSTVTQAMRWGLEKHRIARACVEKHLGQRIPGFFSLERRYRYNLSTGQKSLVNKEEIDRLMQRGKGNDLIGTLEPDVVIHSGDPLRPWAVYDFKFPCPEDNPPSWSRYPSRHPYQGRSQGEMYGKVLGKPAARVAPGWGIIRSSTW